MYTKKHYTLSQTRRHSLGPLRLNTVRDNAESGWTLSETILSQAEQWTLSETTLSQAEHCPGQCWVRLNTIRDSAESGWTLSETALSQDSGWTLSGTMLSQAEYFPRQRWVRINTVRENTLTKNQGQTISWEGLFKAVSASKGWANSMRLSILRGNAIVPAGFIANLSIARSFNFPPRPPWCLLSSRTRPTTATFYIKLQHSILHLQWNQTILIPLVAF